MTDAPAARRRTRMRPEERRESILAAATEVFAETGYRAGKVSAVAARLGVSEPVVFQNFGSKAALFAAVLDRATALAREALGEMSRQAGPVSALLAALLSSDHVEDLHAPGSLGMLFADAAVLTDEPGVADAAGRAVRTVAGLLAEVLRRGQAEGSVRADLDPDAGAWWLLSLMAARPFRAAVAEDPRALEEDLAALTLRALTASGETP
ncbi:TetR/AcrR family transcriptional regulator [Microbispora corallina]|uniref:TetR/AcrR family transcriptional regulator n=1 Tax=Microbispora corallina TaxID=83302 RepID=UPI0019507D26|nr:TetR/AcrR family transcriptional regulator [Microbispora corallina]